MCFQDAPAIVLKLTLTFASESLHSLFDKAIKPTMGSGIQLTLIRERFYYLFRFSVEEQCGFVVFQGISEEILLEILSKINADSSLFKIKHKELQVFDRN